MIRRSPLLIALVISIVAAASHAQSTLLPPECAGKAGAQLDQCVRDVTQPSNTGAFEPLEQKPDPRQLLNCLTANPADEGFCIARNEIVLNCSNPAKHPDFEACVKPLMERPPLPLAANCSRVASAQRSRCALRNTVFKECLKDPWLYFACLGEKMAPN